MNNDQEQEYDVVLDALTIKHDALMSMTMKNMHSEFMGMGIIDDIRLYQCEQLKKAMRMWTDQDAMLETIRARGTT